VATATYAIGPYWTDQCTGACTGVTGAGLGIFTSTSGVAPNRIFNIEWRTAYFNSGGNGVKLNYEVRLYERKAEFDVIYGLVNTFTPPAARNLSTGLQKNATDYTLEGCDSTGGTAPPVSSGELYHYTLTNTSCAPLPPPGGFLYVLHPVNGGNNQIFGYGVNETTGVLTALNGFPLNTGGTGSPFFFQEILRADSVNQRLYAINDGSDTVSAFAINPGTGALTAMPFSPITLGAGDWSTLAIHPTGSPLVVSQLFGNGVKSLNITSSSVGEAAGSPFAGTNAASSTFSRDGNYCYEGGGNGALFAGFSVNPGNGVLTALAGSPFNAGSDNPYAYATDSQGRLFSALNGTSNLLAFTTASGIPSAVTGNPFASGLFNAISSVLHPNEQYYFALGFDSPSSMIGSYRVGGSGAGTTLTPVAGSPFSVTGPRPNLAMNQTGAFLFSDEFNTGEVSTYPVNPSTGFVGSPVVPSVSAVGGVVSLAYANPSMVRTAVSRKTHGAAGIFDINLPLTGTPGVECRSGSGAGSNDHQIVVSCVGTLVSLTDVLIVSGTVSGGSVGASGNVITLNLTGVPNAQRLVLEFRGVSDGVNTGNFTLEVDFLLGDTTGNGMVNASDVSQTKSKSGQAVDVTNFRTDVTPSNSINSSDVSIVKSKSGTALP
jgi:hypothetical protein